MPDSEVRRLLVERGRLFRRYPKATPVERRALDAYRRAGAWLERADRGLRSASARLRKAERLLARRRAEVERLLGKVEVALRRKGLPPDALGVAPDSLRRLPDAELRAPLHRMLKRAQPHRALAFAVAKASGQSLLLRWSAKAVPLERRRLERAEAELARRVQAMREARARLKALGL